MIGFSCIIRVLYVAFTCIEVDGAVDTDVGYQAEAFVDTDVVAYFYGDVQVVHLYFRIGEVRHAGIEQLHTASGLHPGKSRHQHPMVLELIVHGSAQLETASHASHLFGFRFIVFVVRPVAASFNAEFDLLGRGLGQQICCKNEEYYNLFNFYGIVNVKLPPYALLLSSLGNLWSPKFPYFFPS